MKEKNTAYYVAAELQGKAKYFTRKIAMMKELIELYEKAVFLDKEEVQKAIYKYECMIEAYQEAVKVLEQSAEIWGE